MSMVQSEFGTHLMLDCRQCDIEKISSLDTVYQLLDELPAIIEMKKITRPYVFPYEGLVPEDKGITGVVVIAESHITFHSFVEKDYFFFDMFSCRPFDVDAAINHIIKIFDVKDFDQHVISRGIDFPRALQEELPLVSGASHHG